MKKKKSNEKEKTTIPLAMLIVLSHKYGVKHQIYITITPIHTHLLHLIVRYILYVCTTYKTL